MANSNEDQKETKQLKQNPITDSNKQPITAKDATKPKNNFLINRLSFIVATAALIIAVYTMLINHQLQRKLFNEQTKVSSQLEQLKQTQTISQEQDKNKAQSLQQAQSELQDKFDGVEKRVQTAMSQRLYQTQDWLLLKARYYLELAQINSYWSDNYKVSIALLEQADDLLKKINEPKVFDVREALAKEISLLKAVPTLDVTGLLSQLDAAQINVTNLTLQSTINKSEAQAQTETLKTANTSSWSLRLKNSVNVLEKLVVIRRNDEEIKPLLSPLFESTIRESIALNLQEAQWAILNKNPIVYQLALKQAIMNIKKIYKQETQNTAALIKQLNTLQLIKLTQEKPAIGLALPLLNQVIDIEESAVKPTNINKKGEHKP